MSDAARIQGGGKSGAGAGAFESNPIDRMRRVAAREF